MLKLRTTRRTIAMAAATLALAGGTTIGIGGTADAAIGAPNPATTDWFSLWLRNDSSIREFDVCNEQSGPNRVWVGVQDDSAGGPPMLLRDNGDGNLTYGEYINFNRGSCESFTILGGTAGHMYEGFIETPTFYSTGAVTWN